ncbi:MAG: hypothetical protein LQ338_006163 [Usnochroma carphineum]|nr:MAG: hypothetical protein LQ338_006163 [Usnochroma carphineum]
MVFRFLDLPAEIRDQIYHVLVATDNARYPPSNDDEPASYRFDLAILRVNKQINHEAKKAFEDNVFIKITTPWSESIGHISSEGRVPIITAGAKADNFRGYHLWVWIDTPGVSFNGCAYSMLICLDDLPAFTRMWHLSNLNHQGLNSHLRLKLTVQDPHVPDRKIPKDLQNRLLLPFGLVKDLHSLSVHGAKVLPSVEEALKKEQAIADQSPEECLESATALKDAGNISLIAGKYDAALRQYTDAFAAIHITVCGRKRYIHADGYYMRECTSGTYKGQRSDYVRLLIRVKLVANFIHTYLKMEDWQEARFWGKRSIILFRSSLTGDDDDDLEDATKWTWVRESATMGFPARAEMGKILYRTALASRELSYWTEVENLIQAAAIYLPYDETVQTEKKILDERRSEYAEYCRDIGAEDF